MSNGPEDGIVGSLARLTAWIRLTSMAAYFMSISAPAFDAAYTPQVLAVGKALTRDPMIELSTMMEPLFPHFAIAGI